MFIGFDAQPRQEKRTEAIALRPESRRGSRVSSTPWEWHYGPRSRLHTSVRVGLVLWDFPWHRPTANSHITWPKPSGGRDELQRPPTDSTQSTTTPWSVRRRGFQSCFLIRVDVEFNEFPRFRFGEKLTARSACLVLLFWWKSRITFCLGIVSVKVSPILNPVLFGLLIFIFIYLT